MDQLKRRLGQTIISLNGDILQLQKNYKLLRDTDANSPRLESLRTSTKELETKVIEKKTSLEKTRLYITENLDIMDEKKRRKYLTYTSTTIESADKCLEMTEDDTE